MSYIIRNHSWGAGGVSLVRGMPSVLVILLTFANNFRLKKIKVNLSTLLCSKGLGILFCCNRKLIDWKKKKSSFLARLRLFVASCEMLRSQNCAGRPEIEFFACLVDWCGRLRSKRLKSSTHESDSYGGPKRYFDAKHNFQQIFDVVWT